MGRYQQYNRVPFSSRAAETASGGGASGGGSQSLAEATFKSRAMHALTARLRVELATLQTRCAGEAERLLGVQAELADRRAAVDAALRDAKSDKTRWESRVGSLRAATVALKEWLGENENAAGNDGNGEASGSGSAKAACDSAFAEEDVISRQLLRAVARDAALEDAMDCLDEGLEKGRVTLDEYLRLTEDLCKEQFMRARGGAGGAETPTPTRDRRGDVLRTTDGVAEGLRRRAGRRETLSFSFPRRLFRCAAMKTSLFSSRLAEIRFAQPSRFSVFRAVF